MERAAQLQASVDDRPDLGLTLSELEQIAAEAGIEPSFLRDAVRESDLGVGLRDVSGQTNTHVFVERTVPGTLTDDEWHQAVLVLRKNFASEAAAIFGASAVQTHGVSEQLGSTREWRHTSPSGVATSVTIRSIDDAQHIRIQRRVGLGTPRMEGIGYGFMISLLASFIAGGVAESVWVLVMSLVAFLLIFAPTIEWIDRRWRGKKLNEIKEVASSIANIAHNEFDIATDALRDEFAAPAISLDELPEIEDIAAKSTNSGRTRT